jgi:hypothetical protein
MPTHHHIPGRLVAPPASCLHFVLLLLMLMLML